MINLRQDGQSTRPTHTSIPPKRERRVVQDKKTFMFDDVIAKHLSKRKFLNYYTVNYAVSENEGGAMDVTTLTRMTGATRRVTGVTGADEIS